MADFVVLRDITAAPTAAPFNPAGPRTRGAAFGPRAAGAGLGQVPEPRVEVLDLTHSGVREVARDPTMVGVARRMPIKLIAPLEAAAGAGPAAAGDAWGIGAVGADASPRTGAGVTATVLDTGIDAGHPAFAGVALLRRDFTGDGDGQGHGTHCAGTVFGRDVDGRRIGVARGVGRALIGKVLRNNGSGSSDSIHAYQNGGARRLLDLPGFGTRVKPEAMLPLAEADRVLQVLLFFDGPDEGAPRPVAVPLN